jgi:DNA-binding NarL/FixJ family response regulator
MANILIVDSYNAVSSLYCEVLEEYGHHAFPAASGKEALLVALYKTIDIAIVDDKLPDFSAHEVFTRLKQLHPDLRGILSVSSIFGTATEVENWDGWIIKSSDYTVLEGEVGRVAGSSLGVPRISCDTGTKDYSQFSVSTLESEESTGSTKMNIRRSRKPRCQEKKG